MARVGDDRLRAISWQPCLLRPCWLRPIPTGPTSEPLKDLITNTIATKTWVENGGNGTLSDFPTGVWVDPQGVLRPLMKEARTGDLATLRTNSQRPANESPAEQGDVRRNSPLRMISLTRLEKQIELDDALGQGVDDTMKYLAGLRRIEYVFVYPETGDLVVAGPAGDWTVGGENRVVSRETGEPVVRLDDLVVVFRQMMTGRDAHFGCMIDPPRGIAATRPGVPGPVEQAEDSRGAGGPQGLVRAVPRRGRQAGHQGLRRIGSADPGGTHAGRGRLSHETRRHGPGRGRAGREELHEPDQDPAQGRRRAALVVHAQL